MSSPAVQDVTRRTLPLTSMRPLIQNNRSFSGARLTAGLVLVVVWAVLFRGTLVELYLLASSDDGHSHVLAIPFIAGFFFFKERGRIFRNGLTGPGVQYILSGGCLAAGITFWFLGHSAGPGTNPVDVLSFTTASAVLIFLGLLLFMLPGIDLSGAAFPFILLLLLIPIPSGSREALTAFLVKGSAVFTELLLQITGTTFYREGTVFLFPDLSIEIADECSGIRSSIGLFITLLMASHMFLKRWWSKGALLLMVIPMVLIKNAIRITTLTLLSIHVDKMFLTNSPLHRSGGVVFFVISLLIVFPFIVLLKKLEAVR